MKLILFFVSTIYFPFFYTKSAGKASLTWHPRWILRVTENIEFPMLPCICVCHGCHLVFLKWVDRNKIIWPFVHFWPFWMLKINTYLFLSLFWRNLSKTCNILSNSNFESCHLNEIWPLFGFFSFFRIWPFFETAYYQIWPFKIFLTWQPWSVCVCVFVRGSGGGRGRMRFLPLSATWGKLFINKWYSAIRYSHRIF